MKASFKISELLVAGRKSLAEAGIAENGADWLMMDLFDLTQTDLIVDSKLLTLEERERYEQGIKRLTVGTPLAHVTGFQEFYERKFQVSSDVLVPRPETEELVQKVLEHANDGTVVDIGTGSGCIAITLAVEGQFTDVYAVDISSSALEIAVQNKEVHHADVTFFEGDLLKPLLDRQLKIDVLVSNPPYIAQHERSLMTTSVLGYDPELALFAEDDGLALYKRMINQLPEVMNNDGFIFFEIGHAQGSRLKQYIEERYNVNVHVEQDINRLDRIVWFKWCE